jgi:fucose permease
VVGLAQADAALGMGLFMGAMLIGRLINSRLVWKVPAATLVWLSLGLAGAGFGLFWMGPRMLAPAGLAVAGLGVSGLYPLFGSLALGACQGRIVEGSARFTLSSGLAILMLPLLLGRLADWFGIRLAYGLVAVLIGLSLALLGWAASAARQARKAESARLARLYPGDEAAERHAEV